MPWAATPAPFHQRRLRRMVAKSRHPSWCELTSVWAISTRRPGRRWPPGARGAASTIPWWASVTCASRQASMQVNRARARTPRRKSTPRVLLGAGMAPRQRTRSRRYLTGTSTTRLPLASWMPAERDTCWYWAEQSASRPDEDRRRSGSTEQWLVRRPGNCRRRAPFQVVLSAALPAAGRRRECAYE